MPKEPEVLGQDLALLWHIALREFSNSWPHFPIALLLTLVNQVASFNQGLEVQH